MNAGSKKIVARVGDELYDAVKEACEELNSRPCKNREWTITEFVVQALVEKLNHIKRNRKADEKVSSEKVDDFAPREWGE